VKFEGVVAQIYEDASRAELGLSQSSCWKRIRRLETLGFIKGYRADIDLELLGDVVFEGGGLVP